MSHGQAGLATDFGNLSMMRTKENGVLSHVLPMTAAYAGTWSAWREGIETNYKDIVAITNTGENRLTSMSADTGMSEMLVTATRKDPDKAHVWDDPRVLCVNLLSPPATLSAGYALAKEIAEIDPDALMGSSENFIFTRIKALSPGFPWYAIGNASNEVTQIVTAMLAGNLYDPQSLQTYRMSLEMDALSAFSDAGPTHHLLGHPTGQADAGGAFTWMPMEASNGIVAGQMSMWAADGKTQTRMIVRPTHWGQVKDLELAQRMVTRRSQWFLNRGISWTSQPLLVAKTTRDHHGGRAWNGLQGLTEGTGSCVALFFNSVFGALVLRAYGQSPQQGPRANVQVGAIPGLPCPNFGADTPEARGARTVAKSKFPKLSELELEPFPYCFRDKNRHKIDNAAAEMLGLNPDDTDIQAMLAHYRMLFAKEPNVNGRQKRILTALATFGW